MASFIYLFRNHPSNFQTLSPDQMQQTLQKWNAWKEKLEQSGHVKNFGNRLDAAGKVVRGKSKSVTDGPYVEVKDFVQGYTMIEAKDLDEALELAHGCPILESDGSVEVRPVM